MTFFPRKNRSSAFAAAMVSLLMIAMPIAAFADPGDCKFAKTKPVVLKNMGPCQFSLEKLSFAGDPTQQARCLVTPVQLGGKLGTPLEKLPGMLQDHVGQSAGLPDREKLSALLQQRGLAADFAANLTQSVTRAKDNDPAAPHARYFVIHDTSSPNYRSKPWPADIDTSRLNDLSNYKCANKIERAHAFINRAGAVLLAHDFDMPWRATKFEMAPDFDGALKGLFLHVELVQPRRRASGYGRNNDFQAPSPGFTKAQYDGLALLYMVASLRAGTWLIPAYHAVLDEGIYDKHDDPQNFDLARFADSLEKLRTQTTPPKAN